MELGTVDGIGECGRNWGVEMELGSVDGTRECGWD